MSKPTPTILATSGGLIRGTRSNFELGPLIHYGLALSGVNSKKPKICHIGTAMGDQRGWNAEFDYACFVAGIEASHLNLFPMPSVGDPEALLMDQDLIWVGGGSVANLLAIWRLHHLDDILFRVWQSGIVLGGVSAGSLCWHVGGTTDSFGPELAEVTNGLGFLPFGNGVHYDSEAQRRPVLQQMVAQGTIPMSYATDDGVGIVYRDQQMMEAVTEIKGKSAYRVWAEEQRAFEEPITPTLLPKAQ